MAKLPFPLPLLIALAIGVGSIIFFLLLNVWNMWQLVLPQTPWAAGFWPITHYLTTVYLIRRIIGFKTTVTDDEPWMLAALLMNIFSQTFRLIGNRIPHMLTFGFVPIILTIAYFNHETYQHKSRSKSVYKEMRRV